ncbi:MAG TPA: hypothetical protein VHP32_08735 [Ignavibacteria bacterium]|nr:hypothetical protein [Ignavibacteria bacterium]
MENLTIEEEKKIEINETVEIQINSEIVKKILENQEEIIKKINNLEKRWFGDNKEIID